MKKIKLGMVGANGKMGQSILNVLNQGNDFSAELGVVSKGEAKGFKATANSLKRSRTKIDVLIDFSSKDAIEETLHFCLTNKVPLIVGTTGLADSQKKALQAAGKKIPLLYSANMSLGIAALNRAIKCLSILRGFDFQIEETHHTQKKDAPSGTALMLQKTLSESVDQKLPDPIAIRLGGVFGNHRVMAASHSEMLVFEHSALNREVFAEGALKAAIWILDQKPGLYSMEDLFEG